MRYQPTTRSLISEVNLLLNHSYTTKTPPKSDKTNNFSISFFIFLPLYFYALMFWVVLFNIFRVFSATALLQTYQGISSPTVADDSVPLIFKLSYLYYAFLGTLTTVLVGLIVSYLSEQPEPRCLEPKLFAPPIRRFLPQKPSTTNKGGEYHLVNTNLVDRNIDNSGVVNKLNLETERNWFISPIWWIYCSKPIL